MQHGDLDNSVPPLLFLTLDVLAPLPAVATKPHRRSERLHRYDAAVALLEIDAHTVGVMWQIGTRLGVRFDLAVFGRHPDYVEAVARRLEVETVPVREVVGYPTAQHLAASLAYRPDVRGVLDVPAHSLVYGGKYLPDFRAAL